MCFVCWVGGFGVCCGLFEYVCCVGLLVVCFCVVCEVVGWWFVGDLVYVVGDEFV